MIPEDPVSEKTSTEVPGEIVIKARLENPETKTYLQMNESGTYAKVFWKSGDMIKLAFMDANSKIHTLTNSFSTQDEGSSTATFSCFSFQDYSTAVRYYSFYPASASSGFSTNGGKPTMLVTLPSVQQAVNGNIANGLSFSYAIANSLSDEFVFKNMTSLLKFRLTGDGLSSLSKIKFAANTLIAGDRIYIIPDEGNPIHLSNYSFGVPKESPGYEVTLNAPEGGFIADTDYYIAVYPGTTEGFSLTYINNEGEHTIKTSGKTLTMSRSQINDFGTLSVDGTYSDPLVRKYKSKKGSSRPVDLVVIPDGFIAEQRDLFESRASQSMDFMFNTEPFKTYEDYFNVYFIWAASKDSCATILGQPDGYRDTAFGSQWGADDYDRMSADENKIYSFVSSHCPEIVNGTLSIDEVPVLLIINDSRYGGISHITPSGRTYCMAPIVNRGWGLRWSYPRYIPDSDEPITGDYENSYHDRTDEELYEVGGYSQGDWRSIVLHEFGGHSFGRLADEYWYDEWEPTQTVLNVHNWTVPFGLNVTGQYNDVLWQDLLDRKASLVNKNPLYDRIGVFQGGYVSMFNRWRSEKISCMIDNRDYFSTWQRVLIAKRITELAGETFDLDNYLQHYDVIYDPFRDDPLYAKGVNSRGPVVVMPPLPPPVLDDNTEY